MNPDSLVSFLIVWRLSENTRWTHKMWFVLFDCWYFCNAQSDFDTAV